MNLIRSMRPKQWIKNLLVFAVPLAAGKILDLQVMKAVVVAFIALVFASSAVYLVNDVRDIEKDQRHPIKSLRPIAAGKVSSTWALIAAFCCGLVSIVIPLASNEPGLLLVVLVYLVLQISYQTGLRDVGLADIVIVTSGFVLRTLAGGVTSGIHVSSGFLLVTGSSALFIVSAKRFSELVANENPDITRPILRTYSPSYMRTIWSSSMITAVVFYCLWAFELGSSRDDIFVEISTVPFALILLRYAFHVDQGMAEEPESIVLGDRTLQVLVLAWVGLFLLQVA